jgi:ribosomal protein S18 acetylase RimI-like enzyme
MNDLSSVLKIFKRIKAELNKQKNDQWKWIYPNRFNHKTDIKNGTMYGITEGNEYVAVVTLDDKQSSDYRLMDWQDKKGTPCCIHRLAVDPSRQGQGLGKFLLQYVENLAIKQGYSSVRIDVYKINDAAVALYKKNGYVEVGEVRYPLRKFSYITMEKQLI